MSYVFNEIRFLAPREGLTSITAYVSTEQKAELEAWAKEEDRSISYLVAKLVADALEKRKPRKQNEKRSP